MRLFFLKLTELCKKAGGLFSDGLFPFFCLSCNKEGALVCETCIASIDSEGFFACPVCHVENSDGKSCATCLVGFGITRVVALSPYKKNTLLSKMIWTGKYDGVESLFQLFQLPLDDFFLRHPFLFEEIDMIVSVPLHPRRLAERGFNQSEKIAEMLVDYIHRPHIYALCRTRYTKQQAKLSKDERKENVDSAFIVTKDVTERTILLVDDLFTTGSTMNACATELYQAGAKEVLGFVLARG